MTETKKPKTRAAANSNTAAIAVGPTVSAARGKTTRAVAATETATRETATKAAAPRKTTRKTAEPAAHHIDAEQKAAMVARAAYFRAEKRGFEPGHEHEDWLAAEREIDELLSARHCA